MYHPFEINVYSPGTEAELASDKDKNKQKNSFSLLTHTETSNMTCVYYFKGTVHTEIKFLENRNLDVGLFNPFYPD